MAADTEACRHPSDKGIEAVGQQQHFIALFPMSFDPLSGRFLNRRHDNLFRKGCHDPEELLRIPSFQEGKGVAHDFFGAFHHPDPVEGKPEQQPEIGHHPYMAGAAQMR